MYILIAAFLATAAILAVAIPALQRNFTRSYSTGFADGYDLIADNLARGNGYRWDPKMGETMMREPGYPLFLATVFKLGGYRIEAARCANWLLTMGIVLLIMRLTGAVTGDPRIALIASLLFLLHPGTLIAEARGGVEVLFIFASFVFILALNQALEKGLAWRYLVAGLAFGVVLQVRSTPVLFPVLLVFYVVLMAKGARERLRAVFNVGILVLGTAIVLTPWIVRNYRLVDEFVPLTTLGGVALQEGQFACQNFSPGGDFYAAGKGAGLARGELASELGFRFEGLQYFQFFYDPRDEWKFNKLLFQRGKEEYLRRPELLASCVGKNLFNFWFLGKTWRITELNVVAQMPMLILALTGFYLLWKRGLLRKLGIVPIFILAIMAVHLPLVSEARYSIPVFAFLAIPASVSIVSIWLYCRAHWERRTV